MSVPRIERPTDDADDLCAMEDDADGVDLDRCLIHSGVVDALAALGERRHGGRHAERDAQPAQEC